MTLAVAESWGYSCWAVWGGIYSWMYKKNRDSINKELSTKQNLEAQDGDRPTEET